MHCNIIRFFKNLLYHYYIYTDYIIFYRTIKNAELITFSTLTFEMQIVTFLMDEWTQELQNFINAQKFAVRENVRFFPAFIDGEN